METAAKRIPALVSTPPVAVSARPGRSTVHGRLFARPGHELWALEHLFAEPLGAGEVGRRLQVTSAATAQIVDRLAERGHVEREPHPTDRRRTLVRLTESGRTEVLAHLMPMFQALEQVDADLDDAEREVVDRYLRRATGAFRGVLTGPNGQP